jgi:transposase-like protein
MGIQTDLYSFSYKIGTLVPSCKKCGAQHFYRNGKNKNGIQRYQCRNCGFRFLWTSDLPRRNFFSNIMSFAVSIYTSMRMAFSLRGIPILLKQAFDVKVSHETVRQWILEANGKKFYDDKIVNSKTWHADETYIKIKGKGFWLWIVFCKENKKVLAWHISQGRFFEDAKTVLKKALQKTSGILPEKIITDGLYQYAAAIKKVMGWNWRIQKEKHIIDSGIGKNAIIERLNKEIKRRIKWFSTFQSMKGAKAFFGLWFYHYNTLHLT